MNQSLVAPSVVPLQNLRIAVADDNDLYRQYVAGMLASHAGVSVRQCADTEGLLGLLDAETIDCVLVDHHLGLESGLTVAEKLNQKYASPPPAILLSGDGEERTVVKAFRSGFSDYVSKRNLQGTELMATIRQVVEKNSRLVAGREARERQDRLLSFDPVTGIFARHYILETLDQMLESATRRAATQTLIVSRMGNLNGIRDQFGHAIGDRALRAFGMRLQKAARRDDVVGRMGADTFLYLLDREEGQSTVADISAGLAQSLNFEADFGTLRLRLSATLSSAAFPRDGVAAETLLQLAEQRLGAQGDFDPMPHQVRQAPAAKADPGFTRVMDLRSERRQRVLKRGQIVLHERSAVIDCTIRDVSSKGARLSVEHYFAPLDEFDLRFLSAGTNRAAKTRWQSGGNVGVEFIAA